MFPTGLPAESYLLAWISDGFCQTIAKPPPGVAERATLNVPVPTGGPVGTVIMGAATLPSGLNRRTWAESKDIVAVASRPSVSATSGPFTGAVKLNWLPRVDEAVLYRRPTIAELA